MTWNDRAACNGADTSLFDPADGHGQNTSRATVKRVNEARIYCDRCPVRNECAAEGVIGRHYGVWGGQLLTAGSTVTVGDLDGVVLCGTEAAWLRHRRKHETPCPLCSTNHVDRRERQRVARREAETRRRFLGGAA